MLHCDGAVVVEGKYDKAKLKNLIDCPVIVTNGFGIFKDAETAKLIRLYAQKGGIIILKDSDSAGFKIRGYIRGIVPNGRVVNAYIPDIYGKESRKREPSAEGKLGVEGVPDEVIMSALEKCINDLKDGAETGGGCKPHGDRLITRLDLYEDGLSGSKNSSWMREQLLKELSLPQRLPSNSLLDALNRLISYDEYRRLVEKIKQQM